MFAVDITLTSVALTQAGVVEKVQTTTPVAASPVAPGQRGREWRRERTRTCRRTFSGGSLLHIKLHWLVTPSMVSLLLCCVVESPVLAQSSSCGLRGRSYCENLQWISVDKWITSWLTESASMDYQAAKWSTLARVLVRSGPSLESQATSLPLSTCSCSTGAIGSLPTSLRCWLSSMGR